jgi:hypothetical protein
MEMEFYKNQSEAHDAMLQKFAKMTDSERLRLGLEMERRFKKLSGYRFEPGEGVFVLYRYE